MHKNAAKVMRPSAEQHAAAWSKWAGHTTSELHSALCRLSGRMDRTACGNPRAAWIGAQMMAIDSLIDRRRKDMEDKNADSGRRVDTEGQRRQTDGPRRYNATRMPGSDVLSPTAGH